MLDSYNELLRNVCVFPKIRGIGIISNTHSRCYSSKPLINGRITIAADDHWQIAVIGKNLTSEDTFMWGNDCPLGPQGLNGSYIKIIDPPRTVQLTARMIF